jgi:hypothetical protein
VVSQHPPYRITWGEIPHYKGDEGYTDDYEDEADEPFDQELNHNLPLAPLKEVVIVFKIALIAISIQIIDRSSIVSLIKKCP